MDFSLLGPTAGPATDEDLTTLEQQLGRVPRGVVGVAARCVCGRPLVVITKPRLDDGTPFPTTFYLTSPELTKACSRMEADLEMDEFNDRLAEDHSYQATYRRAHEDYLQRRAVLGEVAEISGISAGGMPMRVKCLHAVVGHSLAAGPGVNPIGDEALERISARGWWSAETCTCH